MLGWIIVGVVVVFVVVIVNKSHLTSTSQAYVKHDNKTISIRCQKCGRELTVYEGEYIEAKCDCGSTVIFNRGKVYSKAIPSDENKRISKDSDVLNNGSSQSNNNIKEINMRFCTKCGGKMSEDARFCPHCGSRAFDPKQENTSNEHVYNNIVKPADTATIEETVLKEINKTPKLFDYNDPNMSNSVLGAYATMVSGFIEQVVTFDSVKMLKLALNAKKERNRTVSEYNDCLDNNIVFELYKYDNFLGIFDLFNDSSVNLKNMDLTRFNTLMIEDSQKKVKSAKDYSKENQTIKRLLDRYSTTDTEHREYDYIFSSLKVQAVGVAIQYVLFGKLEGSNNVIDSFDFFRQYTPKANKSALDIVITHEIMKRLSAYY